MNIHLAQKGSLHDPEHAVEPPSAKVFGWRRSCTPFLDVQGKVAGLLGFSLTNLVVAPACALGEPSSEARSLASAAQPAALLPHRDVHRRPAKVIAVVNLAPVPDPGVRRRAHPAPEPRQGYSWKYPAPGAQTLASSSCSTSSAATSWAGWLPTPRASSRGIEQVR